jgi:RNA polymerase sigma-70 factor (ECF subfamily)
MSFPLREAPEFVAIVVETPDHALEAQISADFVKRIGLGDRRAEEELVRRYQRGLIFLLKRRTRDPQLALDLTQETFRIAIEKLRQSPIEQVERVAAYLRGTAVNLAMADVRKHVRRGTTADSDAVDAAAADTAGPFENVSSEQVQRLVRKLLDELPVPRDREILIKTYLEDQDKSAICEALGVDAAHYNRVLFRAKQRFRELLTTAASQRGLKVVG